MTIWDDIYKNFQKGGEAWATLSEDIDPRFKDFIAKNKFKEKVVLDIGCGTGKYLKFLQVVGFKTFGVDSSETAVQMTKNLLGDESSIVCADMFNYEILENKFDLIVSLAPIHHGTKAQVKNVIERIYRSLIDGGMIFVTVPDLESSKKWGTFKDHKEIGSGTYSPLSGPEQGLPHSFYVKKEVEELFSEFFNVNLDLDERGRWFVTASKRVAGVVV